MTKKQATCYYAVCETKPVLQTNVVALKATSNAASKEAARLYKKYRGERLYDTVILTGREAKQAEVEVNRRRVP